MTPSSPRAAATAAAILICLAGCASSQHQSQPRPRQQAGARPAVPARVILDGQTAEWPDGVASLADPNYLYFKVGLESEADLVHAPATTTLLLDADGRTNTGGRFPGLAAAMSLGVDLLIEFSPQDGTGGVRAFALDSDGNRTPLTAEQIGLQVAPSYASQWYEVRVSRLPWAAPALTEVMAGSQSGRTMLELTENGTIVGWSDPEVFPKPAAAKAPAMFDAGVTAKQTGDIRVVSWNVGGAAGQGPETNARPFANVLTALSPDIILVQGWKSDAATLQAWCTALVTGEGEWHARSLPEAGVGIISRFPMDALGTDPLSAATETGGAPRFIAATVHTPLGDAAVASISLAPGESPDMEAQRAAQAAAINRALKSALTGSGPGLRVIGGDLNLALRGPLDTLRAGLDDDGTDLTVADAFVLGDSVLSTWRQPGGSALPARVDYVLFSDAFATTAQALAFDTTRLTEGALARIGLDRGDTGASEHLPIVVDLRPRTP
ncbi:MAG: endonuclease/exonuclease/phosphatase family protein [Phycisphaerales bacterium]|nr:endonuclease/exonuclease/phosphatase family protein [Phycisphaerales bacterium]